MRNHRYIIECRDSAGNLDFTGRQPENVFGMGAIKGMDDDAIAKAVWREDPDATLDGASLLDWPSLIDPRWRARRKTW